ncbi:Transcription factor [Sporothrix curviconia]|uniref:Transcription factor n=1 Tax=Sporothrix curviconia TaxID=1260050 RepID=A0ABP0BAW9_9PEZI
MVKQSPSASTRGLSKSPQQKTKSSPLRTAQQNGNTPDYFSTQVGGGSLSLEPNPFEQSFGSGATAETPGGTKLPSVAALTSPSSLLPGGSTPSFNWGGGSLRTGPLSPAMLSGPTNDYFGDTHLRGGFPTPNESSLRTGLTPGGSGSMFPAPSPSSQAVFAQLQSGGATPGTLDFHRTAMTAAASKREQQSQLATHQQTSAPTSMPQDLPLATSAPAAKSETKAFDQDSNAANSLFLLAQGRGSAQPQAQFVAPPPPQPPVSNTAIPLPPTASRPSVPNQTPVPVPVIPGHQNGSLRAASGGNGLGNGSGHNGRLASEAGSAASDESEPARPNGKAKGKRNSTGDAGVAANGRRKAQDAPAKAPAAKKTKTAMASPPQDEYMDSQSDDDENALGKDGQPRAKMTEEEKRKNFLERNRVAALKCRQRKKQWLQNLQTKVELYSTENESLSTQINQLREEIVNLKTLLLAHKDCPITQQQGLHGTFMQPPMESFNPQMNPYGMAAPIASQPVIAGQVGARRFS